MQRILTRPASFPPRLAGHHDRRMGIEGSTGEQTAAQPGELRTRSVRREAFALPLRILYLLFTPCRFFLLYNLHAIVRLYCYNSLE